MSAYGLIKATSRAMRSDTITDLTRINHWLWKHSFPAILSYGQSVRALENSVALGLDKPLPDMSDFPKLERGIDFYKSIVPEISQKEKEKFLNLNS